MTNREVVAALLERLGKPWSLVRSVPDRPGHDRRYALDGSKLAALGWRNRTAVRRRPRHDDRLVPGQRGVVARREVRRLGRLLRAPVRIAPGRWRPRGLGAGPNPRADGCGSRSPAPAAGSAGPSSPRSRTRRSPASPVRSPGIARRSTSTLPTTIHALLDRDRPEAVIHAAAWTDVDGCAREPELARRRNAEAVHVLAEATAARDIDLVHVSTNEVFDGRRTDGRGYGAGRPDEPDQSVRLVEARRRDRSPRRPIAGRKARLGIVRTAWLYGPPGNDFPSKILAAAERARAAGEPLRVVADEFGSPTFTHDLAEAIVELLGSGDVGGIHHVVNGGIASRATWARELFRQAGLEVDIEEVPASTWAAGIDAAGLGRPRADAASRRRAAPAVAATPSPTTCPALLRQRAAQPAARPASIERDRPSVARSTASGSARSPRHADARGSFRELWRASAFPTLTSAETGAPAGPSHASSRPTCRRRPAGVLRGLHYHRRQLDYWVVASGRAFVALVDVRPLLDGSGDRPIVETRELAADDWVVIPAGVAHGFLALEPLDLLYLVTNEFDGSRRARVRLGRPGGRRSVAARRRRRPTAGRSSPTATARTPRSRSWWPASARSEAGASPHPRRTGPRTATPPVTAFRTRRARWGHARRDHPAIVPGRSAATLPMHSSDPQVDRSGAHLRKSAFAVVLAIVAAARRLRRRSPPPRRARRRS